MLAEQKVFFQRNSSLLNPNAIPDSSGILLFVKNISSLDTMTEHIRCLRPISERSENPVAEDLVKLKDLKMMQRFFSEFWLKRDPRDPQGAWLLY